MLNYFFEIKNENPRLQSSQKVNLRIGLIGPPKSGKTALLVRFLTGRFIGEYFTGKVG